MFRYVARCMMKKGAKPTQRERLEQSADKLLAKGKAKAALKKYRAVQSADPTRAAIYPKLIAAHQAATAEWGPEDFAESLAWEMRHQELLHPELQGVHERLAPEWREVTDRLRRLIITNDDAVIAQLTEEIAAYGAKAVRPLLEVILLMKGKPA